MSVLEKEFFVEQFRKLHDCFNDVNKRFDRLESEQRQMREEMSIMREQVGTLVTEHYSIHHRMDLLQKRLESVEARVGIDTPEH